MFNFIRAWWANRNKLPAVLMTELETEGILLLYEHIHSKLTYRNFKAPGKRFGYKTVRFRSTIVLTKTRVLATSYGVKAINVPYADERIRAMNFSVEDGPKILVAFDASLFQPTWSGSLEYRFSTTEAGQFVDTLQKEIGVKNG